MHNNQSFVKTIKTKPQAKQTKPISGKAWHRSDKRQAYATIKESF
jgi:hypothetical protein